jgi:hypothetical protein
LCGQELAAAGKGEPVHRGYITWSHVLGGRSKLRCCILVALQNSLHRILMHWMVGCCAALVPGAGCHVLPPGRKCGHKSSFVVMAGRIAPLLSPHCLSVSTCLLCMVALLLCCPTLLSETRVGLRFHSNCCMKAHPPRLICCGLRAAFVAVRMAFTVVAACIH